MGGCNQIDIFRPLGDEVFHHLPQLYRCNRAACRRSTDGTVLALPAPQRAAAKKDRTAAAAACQNRFFPFMYHRFGNQRPIRAAAKAHLSCRSVHAALPGTQFAVYIIHLHPLLLGYLFFRIRKIQIQIYLAINTGNRSGRGVLPHINPVGVVHGMVVHSKPAGKFR